MKKEMKILKKWIKKMQIEEDLTKDFKWKIFQKLNDLKEKDNADKENIPNHRWIVFIA